MDCISLSTLTLSPVPPAAVLCLGNFDGVHLAHKALVRECRALRDRTFPDAVCAVFCFREPSWSFLRSDPPALLCTLEDKLQLLAQAGAEYAFIADFPSICSLQPNEFISMLVSDAHMVGACCGFNYRFGKGGVGTPETLKTLFDAPISILGEISLDGNTVSSTRIRTFLEKGEVASATRLLGRPYSFSAPVVHGKALGKKLGSPTVNQYFPEKMLIPRRGVYVTECEVDGVSFRAVSNVGSRPTVEKNASVNCETYLLDFSGDLYDRSIKVSFLQFLRPEQRFDTSEALARQIHADINSAREYRAEV